MKKQNASRSEFIKSADEKIVQIAGPKDDQKVAATSAARKQRSSSIGTIATKSSKTSGSKTKRTKAKTKGKSSQSA